MAAADRIVIENVNVPGSTTRASKAMYDAMQQAMWKVLPATAPGLTESEICDAVAPHRPEDLYPGGAKAAGGRRLCSRIPEARGTLVRGRPSRCAGTRLLSSAHVQARCG